jgi:hypothetical protein
MRHIFLNFLIYDNVFTGLMGQSSRLIPGHGIVIFINICTYVRSLKIEQLKKKVRNQNVEVEINTLHLI